MKLILLIYRELKFSIISPDDIYKNKMIYNLCITLLQFEQHNQNLIYT